MRKYRTLTDDTIELATPDAETRSLLDRLEAMLRDRDVSAEDMARAIEARENPAVARALVAGPSEQTPHERDTLMSRVMSDMLARKRIEQAALACAVREEGASRDDARVPDASEEPLEVCEGLDAHFVLRVKAPVALIDRLEERGGDHWNRVTGKIAPWRRVIVRVAHRERRSLRLFVLEPGPTMNEIKAGPFSVRGKFVITEKVNNTKRVDAEWRAREAR